MIYVYNGLRLIVPEIPDLLGQGNVHTGTSLTIVLCRCEKTEREWAYKWEPGDAYYMPPKRPPLGTREKFHLDTTIGD